MRFLRHILYMVFMGAACTGTSEFYKRAPGFPGVRDKRSVLQEEPTTDKDGGTIKNEMERNLATQKRSLPEIPEDDGPDKPFTGWIQDNNIEESVFKRAPSAGFFGMRGKKYYYDERGPDKRARLTNNFFGMRGKKQLLQDISQYPSDKRLAPAQNFMGMRGSNLYEDVENNELSSDYIDSQSEDKRAPKFSSSFFGMRGKKDDEEVVDVGGDEMLSEAEKRARNLFFGMRGRRDLASKEIVDEKRAYNAFFGMRGKRVYEDYLDDPSMHALYGMRGKKHRGRSKFFGMPGKEIRGKFVGVRGKKSTKLSDMEATENGIELQRVNSNDLGDLMFLIDEEKSNKKAAGDEFNTIRQNDRN